MRRFYLIGLSLIFSSVALSAAPSEEFSTTQVVLMAKTEAILSSQIDATVKSLPLQEGELFDQGDVLLEFDCTVYEAQLSKAEALLESKRAAYNSHLKMSKAKAASKVELLNSKAEFIEAESDVKIKKHNVDYCKIVAPFNGQLVKIHANEHESLSKGTPLVDILDNSELTIELIVPSDWLAWLKNGSSFDLYVEETKKAYPALVTKILPRVDSVSQSVRVLGKLAKGYPELIAGMSGKARFQRNTYVRK